MNKLINYTVLMAAVVALAACGGRAANKADKVQRITVTIEPVRYFTEAIAGDKFEVLSMVPKGTSPETYDPTPKQLVDLGESTAYFRIGYIGFEQVWMDRLMQNAPHIQVFDLSQGIDLIREEGHQHGDHYHEGGVEPHIWNSAVNAKIMAGHIFHALCVLDKSSEAYFLSRYDSLVNRIDCIDEEIRTLLQREETDKAFLIYHPALSYFARDYGLTQISLEEGGREPSPAQLKELIGVCRANEVKVIFVQPEFDRRNAEIVARETSTAVVPINPLAYEWEDEMLHTARILAHQTDINLK